MSLSTFHEFKHEGKHYRFVYDEDHETVGSYAYDTPEETKAAEDEELRLLASGEWVVLGCIVTQPCDNPRHCSGCNGHEELDSCWGIVIENSDKAAEAFARKGM